MNLHLIDQTLNRLQINMQRESKEFYKFEVIQKTTAAYLGLMATPAEGKHTTYCAHLSQTQYVLRKSQRGCRKEILNLSELCRVFLIMEFMAGVNQMFAEVAALAGRTVCFQVAPHDEVAQSTFWRILRPFAPYKFIGFCTSDQLPKKMGFQVFPNSPVKVRRRPILLEHTVVRKRIQLRRNHKVDMSSYELAVTVFATKRSGLNFLL